MAGSQPQVLSGYPFCLCDTQDNPSGRFPALPKNFARSQFPQEPQKKVGHREPGNQKFQFGQSTVTLETGRIARQASGAVLVTVDDDVSVLVTVVGAKQADPGKGFFPLSVHYQEKTYAAGKIPGGFFKREGRPSEKETLTSRLIDRPIRPLFPEGFMNEVQVVCTVVSTSKKTDPDIAAMIGTSAALAISGIPFDGPIGAARVAFHESTGYLLNPTYEQQAASSLDMVVAGTSDAVLMVESEAKELTEDQMLGAVLFAHDEFQVVINAVKELAAEAAKPTWTWAPAPEATELLGAIRAEFGEAISQAYTITVKADRYARLGELKDQVVAKLSGEEGQPSSSEVKAAFGEIEYRTVRENIVNGKPRIDGRDTKTVRPLNIEVGVLPKTHGSALFTRGETQALVVATLGTARDAQLLDTLEGEKKTRSCCTTTSLRSRWASVVAWVALVVAKSVTAVWPVVRFRPCCLPPTCSRTPSALCRKSPNPTVRAPWLPFAALPWP